MGLPHDIKLENYTVSGGSAYTWPSDAKDYGRLQNCNSHRISLGTANVTLQVRYESGGSLETVTPPTDWSTTETLLLKGVYQFVITADTGTDVTANIEGYRE